MEQGKARKTGGLAVTAGVFLLVGALVPHGAHALTADGAVMTNTAYATFSGIAGLSVGYRTTYNATERVLICNPIIHYSKVATPTMVIPTGTVVFTLCIINNSATTSAFNMVVSDKLPDNMSYAAPSLGTWPAPAPTMSWAAAMAGPWTNGAEPPNGQLNPFFMRWTFPLIGPGPGRSACVQYTARVL